jgi:hypothetical protein
VTTLLPPEMEDDDVRVAMIGNVDSGKSTLIGVLTHASLDDGRGGARKLVLKHRHEQENGRTSAVTVRPYFPFVLVCAIFRMYVTYHSCTYPLTVKGGADGLHGGRRAGGAHGASPGEPLGGDRAACRPQRDAD